MTLLIGAIVQSLIYLEFSLEAFYSLVDMLSVDFLLCSGLHYILCGITGVCLFIFIFCFAFSVEVVLS